MKKLIVAAALAALVAGCGNEEEKKPLPEVYPAAENAYMKDPAFKKQVADANRRRDELLQKRNAIADKFEALVAKLGGDREKARKTPEWMTLVAELSACDGELEQLRKETLEMVRNRLQKATADGKLVREGKAVPAK